MYTRGNFIFVKLLISKHLNPEDPIMFMECSELKTLSLV